MTATTEIDLHRPPAQPSPMTAKIAYARALAESGLLPGQYRKNPANILWAAEFGDMLGLSTMAAITGVHVIDGRPTASAGLISALVRRAGHKLRVSGDTKSATCQIVRSDDPKYTFEVTFTIDDAKAAGLAGKDVWKKYAASMLKARAITQCARDACEEALFGLHYTPEELGADVDEDGVVVDDTQQQEPAARLAERSGGTPPEDPWYVRPEPNGDSDEAPPDDGWPGVDQAIKDAASFKTEAAATRLYRETAAARLAGQCTTDEATHIQNIITARIHERRRQASEMNLRTLSETDDWRAKVEELAPGDDDTARQLLDELGQLKGAGTMTEQRAGRIGAAIIALCPKAVIKDTEATA